MSTSTPLDCCWEAQINRGRLAFTITLLLWVDGFQFCDRSMVIFFRDTEDGRKFWRVSGPQVTAPHGKSHEETIDIALNGLILSGPGKLEALHEEVRRSYVQEMDRRDLEKNDPIHVEWNTGRLYGKRGTPTEGQLIRAVYYPEKKLVCFNDFSRNVPGHFTWYYDSPEEAKMDLQSDVMKCYDKDEVTYHLPHDLEEHERRILMHENFCL